MRCLVAPTALVILITGCDISNNQRREHNLDLTSPQEVSDREAEKFVDPQIVGLERIIVRDNLKKSLPNVPKEFKETGKINVYVYEDIDPLDPSKGYRVHVNKPEIRGRAGKIELKKLPDGRLIDPETGAVIVPPSLLPGPPTNDKTPKPKGD